ncbi:hypothetical protein [Bradyrhizobium sp. CCBAU 45384]|uniref:hypothetical protein n=1 Tax=Bradyrhizobium sp. CCBAU 45384 TaxID=858428 RepID=UPI0023061846|nr:hypothetical protein [Bradyrhizobium sp. CCBAU 45384]
MPFGLPRYAGEPAGDGLEGKIAPLAGLTTSAAHLIEREWGAVFGGKTESRD